MKILIKKPKDNFAETPTQVTVTPALTDPKELARIKLAKLRGEIAAKESFVTHDKIDSNQEHTKEPVTDWQKEMKSLIPEITDYTFSLINSNNEGVFFSGEGISVSVKRKYTRYECTISVTDKICLDVFDCDINNLRVGLEIIKGAMKKWHSK